MSEPYILRHCPKRKGLVRVPYIPELGGFPGCTCDPNATLPICETTRPTETTSELIARSERVLKSLAETHPEVRAVVEKPKSREANQPLRWNSKTKKFE